MKCKRKENKMFNIEEELKKLPQKPRCLHYERQKRHRDLCWKSCHFAKSCETIFSQK